MTGRKRFVYSLQDYPGGGDFLLPDREYTLKVTATVRGDTGANNFSFTYGFITSSKFGDHVKLDFGLGYAPLPKAWFGFTTVNLYLTPINDETDLMLIKSFRRNVFLRTSFFFGVSPFNFNSDTKQPIKNKYGVGNFVYGVAIRSPLYGSHTPFFTSKVGQKLLQPMRLKFGYFLFKQANANALINADLNKRAVFYGVSYDLNISTLLGPVAKFISP